MNELCKVLFGSGIYKKKMHLHRFIVLCTKKPKIVTSLFAFDFKRKTNKEYFTYTLQAKSQDGNRKIGKLFTT